MRNTPVQIDTGTHKHTCAHPHTHPRTHLHTYVHTRTRTHPHTHNKRTLRAHTSDALHDVLTASRSHY